MAERSPKPNLQHRKLQSGKLESITEKRTGVNDSRTETKMGVPRQGSKPKQLLGIPIPKSKANSEQRTIKNKKQKLNLATWNIKRGLIKREIEIKEFLISNDLDVLFLTETDINIEAESDYKLQGYKTLFKKRKQNSDKVRLIALIKEEKQSQIKIKEELMSDVFPSIWLEIKSAHKVPVLVAGIYRQWSHNGAKLGINQQTDQIKVLINQMQLGNESYEKIIMMGDVNLDSNKWEDDGFPLKSVSNPLLVALEECDLVITNLGNTYQADHMLSNGTIPESALDHVYSSKKLKNQITPSKIENSSTDHLPVMVTLNTDEKLDKSKFKRKITKRSMKNFSVASWNQCLANKDWSKIDDCTDVNEMVSIFTEKINETLDEVTPIKTFTIKSNYKFGLSENTKKLMQERDCTRKLLGCHTQ